VRLLEGDLHAVWWRKVVGRDWMRFGELVVDGGLW